MTDTPQQTADADTVAERAAQVITSMGADIRALTSQRDRYRTAWCNARERAQAYGEGILRVVGDREQWQEWLRQTEAAAEQQRLALSQALGLGTGAPWDAIRDRAAELAATSAPVSPAPAEFELRGTGEIRAAALTEAADFLRDAHFDEGLTVQEIGTALRHWADRERADAASGPGGVAGETQAEPAVLTPCTCRQAIHKQEHRTPVAGCPWCTKTTEDAAQDPAVSQPDEGPTP
jgi:hypothetical protein